MVYWGPLDELALEELAEKTMEGYQQKLTLITGNLKHFQRVPQLAVENWLNA